MTNPTQCYRGVDRHLRTPSRAPLSLILYCCNLDINKKTVTTEICILCRYIINKLKDGYACDELVDMNKKRIVKKKINAYPPRGLSSLSHGAHADI